METIDGVITTANAFFRDLAANNNRDWFQANKVRYEAAVKGPAAMLSEVIGADIAAATGAQQTAKVFRINRDIRFSRDKTPYNTHLHILWKAEGAGMDMPSRFLGISPDYVTVGLGSFGFSKPGLDRFRAAVAGPDGAALEAALAEAAPRLDPPELKRVPKPYDAGHARAELLKRKGLAAWIDLGAEPHGGLRAATAAAFARLAPIGDWLGDHL